MEKKIRNVDKIKQLKHELGRYADKISRQEKQIEELRREVVEAHVGNQQINAAVDAMMAQVALRYGKDVMDGGKVLGKQVTLPIFSVEKIHDAYEVRMRADREKGVYIIAVVEREQEEKCTTL